MAEIKRLMSRADIIRDLIEYITPKYFPNEVLDKNRMSTFGYLTESLAVSMEDTLMLEQTRAADYCPELSNNEIHVQQTAKLRDVSVARATPASCIAIIGILKSDIISKGAKLGNGDIQFLIDRRSTIMYGQINLSLEDDIIIRATQRNNKYYYTANYTMEHTMYTTVQEYLQVYEYVNGRGEELLGMVVRLLQCKHSIKDLTVIDMIEFTYEGLHFEYSNRVAAFEVYYKASPTETEYTRAKLDQYLTTASPTNKMLYYNDDESGVIKIINNPHVGLTTNSIIRTEIIETLGEAGNVSRNGVDRASFTMYQDAAYNYSGVYVYVSLLSDIENGRNGDLLSDVKKRLIDAKTRRSNITTEHDIISYINDVDANIQLVKKRNDVQDRNYYMYTLMRTADRHIAPATTKTLILSGPVSKENPGDFDYFEPTVKRKMLKANNRFRLHVVSDGQDNDYVTKVPNDMKETLIVDPAVMPDPEGYNEGDTVRVRRTNPTGYTDRTYTIYSKFYGTTLVESSLRAEANLDADPVVTVPQGARVYINPNLTESDFYYATFGDLSGYIPTAHVSYESKKQKFYEEAYYLTCPYLIAIDDLDIAAYYFNSVNADAALSMQGYNTYFPFQVISRAVHIYRDSHSRTAPDTYTFTVVGTMNTENDKLLVDADGNIIDKKAIICYLFFTVDNDIRAYLPMEISDYDVANREFTFTGSIRTSDYITEDEKLEIIDGLYKIGGNEGNPVLYDSVIDYKDASFTVAFMYKQGEDYREYLTTDNIFSLVPTNELTYVEKVGAKGSAIGDISLYADKTDESAVLCKILNTETFTIDDEKSDDSWYYVTYTDGAGEEYTGYLKNDETVEYEDILMHGGYVLMNAYYNNQYNLYNLLLEFGKFTRSPVILTNTGGASQNVRAFGPIMESDETINEALDIIRKSSSSTEATNSLMSEFGIDATSAAYVLNNRIRMLQSDYVTLIRTAWEEYKAGSGSEAMVQYTIKAVPFFEWLFGVENTAELYPTFKNDVDVYSALLKQTTDFEVALKFIATYGPSKYINITGGRDLQGQEVTADLADLNPTFYFKVYGVDVPMDQLYQFIYEYLRDNYITDSQVFMSNICTAVEEKFKTVVSIKFMGVDSFDASYQQLTFTPPKFISIDVITRYIPEQLNVTDIQIEFVDA